MFSQPISYRKARGVKHNATPLYFLTAAELKAVGKRQSQITTLIELGMTYQQIKAVLSDRGIYYQTTLKTPVTA